jgi:branched-subunit amino acid ABC-type transport system permease component
MSNMSKKKYQIQISLYILVPFIASGAALLWVLLTYQVVSYIYSSKAADWVFWTWEAAVVIITCLMSLLIMWLILEPVSRFIKKAESLPVYPASTAYKENPPTADAIAHYSQVFDQITSILSKVEAKELFPGSGPDGLHRPHLRGKRDGKRTGSDKPFRAQLPQGKTLYQTELRGDSGRPTGE